ncbi:MAG: DUF805 domain-containing protein [Alteriqipengyuania sp.]
MIDQEGLKSIEKLHEMKANGILSEQEFEVAKARLLSGKSPSTKPKVSMSSEGRAIADNDLLAWAALPLKRYAEFGGRSRRREFWFFLLATNVIAGVLALVWMADTGMFGNTGTLGTLAMIVLGFGFLAVLVPYIALQVRRFHDQGRSGWLALINLLPYVGPLIVLIFMLIPGVEGDNDYGSDPRA